VSNNKIGISSPVPSNDFVEVSGIKVLAGFGYGTQKMIIDGMIKAIDSGADVISMSLGGKSTEQREKAYTEVVEYARKHGVIIVTAAGNSAKDASQFCPANSAGVIAVAAVDENLKRTSFSNTLQHIKFGLAAPGKDILSTYPKNEYKNFSGTSMAAPYVSGTIAVLRSINPDLTVEQAFQLLHETGLETEQPYKTGNFIQPYKAVKKMIEGKL
jgi:thermitase